MGSRVCARLGVGACDRVRAHVRAFSPTGSPVYLGAEVVAVVALFRDDLPCEASEPGIIIVQCTQRVGTVTVKFSRATTARHGAKHAATRLSIQHVEHSDVMRPSPSRALSGTMARDRRAS